MPVNYTKLWKLLADRNLGGAQLKDAAQIGASAVEKLERNEAVPLDTLEKVCAALGCGIGEVLEFVPPGTGDGTRRKGTAGKYLKADRIYCGESEQLMKRIRPGSVAVSVWSPPYHVGKDYESGQSYGDWVRMLGEVIRLHTAVLKPGGFLAVNIGDILCFPDADMPRIQANNVSMRKCSVTEEDVRRAQSAHPDFNRYQLAEFLGCSEQTVDRRLHGNNIRGGKYNTQTRVKIVGGMLEELGLEAGLFLYDRRVWVKDAAWANSNWTTNSYRAVDEFEYVYIFWKPGETRVDRKRLTKEEWTEWGSRGVWNIRSVQRNDDHEAKFPLELPRRVIQLLSDRGETVLDCFMGSGTSAMAAIAEGRHYIGIEKEERYVRLARANIRAFSAQAAPKAP